jgi:serine acetyltransferase
VTRDVPAGKLAVGMPARIREPRAPQASSDHETKADDAAGDDATPPAADR